MPAGAAQLAFGAVAQEYQRSEVDYTAVAGLDGTCFSISQEACSTPLSGGFNVSGLYGELFLPLLKDAPFAKALNVTFGTRFSDYSNFGNTTNSKLQVEWRPIDDLLRGTVAGCSRAPEHRRPVRRPWRAMRRPRSTLCGLYQRPGPRQRVRRVHRRHQHPARRHFHRTEPDHWRGLGFGRRRLRCSRNRASPSTGAWCGDLGCPASRPAGLLAHLPERQHHHDRCPDRAELVLPTMPARSARSSTASPTARSTSSPSRP